MSAALHELRGRLVELAAEERRLVDAGARWRNERRIGLEAAIAELDRVARTERVVALHRRAELQGLVRDGDVVTLHNAGIGVGPGGQAS